MLLSLIIALINYYQKEKYNRRVLELDDELKPLRGNNQKIQGCQVDI
jgi:hypothetical protein